MTEVATLTAFRPYLRILQAFNWENFAVPRKERLSRIPYACAVGLGAIMLAAMIALGFWQIADEHFSMRIFTTSFPIIISLTQVLLAFVLLASKNRQITATIHHLQAIITDREFFFH